MPSEILNVAALQLDFVWESPSANRLRIDDFLSSFDRKVDIVFLPEMFTTGFSMNVSHFAEPMDGETINWMKKRSEEHQFAVCGSLIVRENANFYNRLVFVEPSGEIQFYDKRHLFSMGNENHFYSPGSDRLIVTYKGWRICPLICYDLRVPVWSRNRNEYDLLFYAANWPQSRNEVWNTLLKARAIENQSFVVGVNRVGVDGNLISYSGNSQIINPKGDLLSEIGDNQQVLVSAGLSHSALTKFRNEFPVLNDGDQFDLK